MFVRLLGTAALALAIVGPAAAAGGPGTIAPQSMAPHDVYPEARHSMDQMGSMDRMRDEADAKERMERDEMRSSEDDRRTMDEKERGTASPQSVGELYPQSE